MHHNYPNTFFKTHLIKMLKLILRTSTSFKNYYGKMLVQRGLSLHYLVYVLSQSASGERHQVTLED